MPNNVNKDLVQDRLMLASDRMHKLSSHNLDDEKMLIFGRHLADAVTAFNRLAALGDAINGSAVGLPTLQFPEINSVYRGEPAIMAGHAAGGLKKLT